MNQFAELKLQSEIDRYVGEIVTKAEGLIESKSGVLGGLEPSQLRNVLSVAISAPHIAVVTNFIKYQMGRSSGKNPWKESSLGGALIEELENLESLAQGVVREAGTGDVNEVHVRLARLFLGFMNRYFVYEKAR